jgi:hypothetical protein
MTLAQATRWVEERDAAVMAKRDWRLGVASWWELAALAIDVTDYQHLLFTQTPEYVGFQRQFFDDGDVHVIGFMWQLKSPGPTPSESLENIVCTFGALEELPCETLGALDPAAFRVFVERSVAEYCASGVQLTGDSII